jgi:hypothetical protein
MAQNEALEKLASTGLLKPEPPGREEIAGLLRTAAVRLEDARKTTNAPESRFDLAYNAATRSHWPHSASMATAQTSVSSSFRPSSLREPLFWSLEELLAKTSVSVDDTTKLLKDFEPRGTWLQDAEPK